MTIYYIVEAFVKSEAFENRCKCFLIVYNTYTVHIDIIFV
jgi:hypothetical protein